MSEKLLTTSEAAKYLNMSPFTLGYWRKNYPDRLPFLKMGESQKQGVRVMYRLQDLDEFLRNNIKGTSPDDIQVSHESEIIHIKWQLARMEMLLQHAVNLLQQRN